MSQRSNSDSSICFPHSCPWPPDIRQDLAGLSPQSSCERCRQTAPVSSIPIEGAFQNLRSPVECEGGQSSRAAVLKTASEKSQEPGDATCRLGCVDYCAPFADMALRSKCSRTEARRNRKNERRDEGSWEHRNHWQDQKSEVDNDNSRSPYELSTAIRQEE